MSDEDGGIFGVQRPGKKRYGTSVTRLLNGHVSSAPYKRQV